MALALLMASRMAHGSGPTRSYLAALWRGCRVSRPCRAWATGAVARARRETRPTVRGALMPPKLQVPR
eukprot:7513294-Alexandrium_andersonii.AAC.1